LTSRLRYNRARSRALADIIGMRRRNGDGRERDGAEKARRQKTVTAADVV
jgi:hypothetical protein